jgi:translation elongation factor EF-Ts
MNEPLMSPVVRQITLEQQELIIKLRENTGYGMLSCKKALISANWNYNEAILYLKNCQIGIIT